MGERTEKLQLYAIESHLRIEVVGEVVDEGGLDGVLVGEEGEVVRKAVVCGDDGAVALRVELGTTCATEDLQHVQDAEVHCGALG